MDWATFENDVWENVSESRYIAQETNSDGVIVTIGETWQGALYGAEENEYGQRAVYLFDTEGEQVAWFEAVTSV